MFLWLNFSFLDILLEQKKKKKLSRFKMVTVVVQILLVYNNICKCRFGEHCFFSGLLPLGK